MRVLVCSPETPAKIGLEEALSNCGHEWTYVPDCAKAVERLKPGGYSLILLDWNSYLPAVACQTFRELPHGNSRIIMALIRENHPTLLRQILEAGADDYIRIPLPEEVLAIRFSVAERRVHNRSARLKSISDLQSSEEKYKALLERMNEGLFIVDAYGIIQFVNDRYCQMLGQTRRELIGKSNDMNLAIVEAGFTKEKLNQRKQGLAECYEVQMKKKTGEHFWVRVSASPVMETDGKFAGSMCIVTDITDARLAHEALKESRERLEAAIESLPFDFWVMGRDGRFLLQNSTSVKHWGDLRGKQAVDADIEPEILDLWNATNARAFAGETVREEAVFRHGWQTMAVEQLVTPIVRDGEVQAILGVHIDKTSHMHAQQETKRMEAEKSDVERRFRELFQNAVTGIFQTSPEGQYLNANPAIARMYGYDSPEELMFVMANISRQLYVNPDARIWFVQEMERKGEVKDFEVQVRRKDGTVIWVRENARAVKNHEGQIMYYEGFVEDVTAKKEAEEALARSEERYKLASRGANDGLWDWDLPSRKAYFSPRWKSMAGCLEEEIGDDPEDWFRRVHPEDLESLRSNLASHLAGEVPHFQGEYRLRHKDGAYRWMLSRGMAIFNSEGKATRIAGSQTDITTRKVAELQLYHEAFHDTLTGLPNRALLLDRLEQASRRSKRRGNTLFAVLFLDMDRFKIVNDSLGHRTGDQLLIEAARRLEQCLRPGDSVARLGGDEFIVLLDELKQREDAEAVAERVLDKFSAPFSLYERDLYTGVSVGIAYSSNEYERPDELIRDADAAMYRAKSRGRNRYEIFEKGMHVNALTLLHLESDLRLAIEREEFEVFFQPIVTLDKGKMEGFEALARWRHPQRGLVSPAEFIPLAEETGMIIPLTWYILEESCRQLSMWNSMKSLDYPLSISVNLASKCFHQADLLERIRKALIVHNLPGHLLKLEITESALMENFKATVDTIMKIKDLKCQFLMDDFGTGYSSLSYLHRLPIDALKIDRSFVNRMSAGGKDQTFVATILNLAKNLNLRSIAEGIETKEQYQALKELNCEAGQGYLFSKPAPGQIITELIASKPSW